MKNKLLFLILLIGIVGIAVFTFGNEVNAQGIKFENPLVYEDFGELVDGIVDFIFNISIVIVPLAIVIGAFFLLISGGDPEKIKTGKSIILYSLIGLVIVLFAKGLIAMIEDILKVEIGG